MSVNFDYSTLFYLSPLPNWVYEIETFRILDVNQAAIHHYGYSREEFLDMTIKDLRPKEDIPKVLNAHKDIENREGNIYFGIFTHQKKNGEKISMDINGHKVEYKGKKCMAVICQDVTFKKKEEQHLKLLESVITNTNDAIMITEAEPFDEPGPKIIYVNGAFTRMTGYTSDEVIGKTPRILQGPKSDREELDKLGRALRKWESCEITTINYKKNGDPFWINISVSPVADENGYYTHFIAIERDVTSIFNDKTQKDLLAKISEGFNVNDDLKSSLDQLCQLITDFGEYNFCEVWLPTIHKNALKLFSHHIADSFGRIFYQYAAEINEICFDEGLPGKVWKEKIPITLEDVEQSEIFVRKHAIKKAEIRTVFGLPLIHQNEMVGVMVVGTQSGSTKIRQHKPVLAKLESYIGSEINRKRLEEDLSHLFEALPDIICLADFKGRYLKMNKAGCELLGYGEDEIVGSQFEKFVHPADLDISRNELKKLNDGQTLFKFENRIITKEGKIVWLSWYCNSSLDEGVIYATAKDITAEKKLKEMVNDATKMARIGGWEIDLLNNKIHWSEVVHQIHGTDPNSFEPTMEMGINFYREDYQEMVSKIVEHTIETGDPADFEAPLITEKGNQIWVRVIGNTEFSEGKCIRIFGSFQDIHTSKSTALQLEEILGSISDAFYAVDRYWNFTYFNKEAENLLKRKSEDLLGKNIWDEFAPAQGTVLEAVYKRVAETGKPESFDYNYPGDGCWYEVNAYPSNGGVSSYFKNIDERKKHEKELNDLNAMLKKNIHELELSNEQLEQFAYIASHDLQEPLRMISSFLNLLQKNYKTQLDEKAHQYIYYATDGARRMKQIILDLLEYSRAGEFSEDMEVINLDKILEEYLILRKKAIEEKSVHLKIDKLPKVECYKAPLVQTIHCLLDNAIKYSKDKVPSEISLSVRESEEEWIFEIKDNGIGIDPSSFDKIFIIFQRLHNRDQFDGTGIGLSIAKKHVESWGGKIWVESEPGVGSIFYFTIKKQKQ